MDSKEAWNFIVNDFNSKRNEREEVIQKTWENYCSEIFGYKKIFNEIISQRKVTIGSYERIIPDIILSKDGKDLVDIELKQYSLDFSQKMEKQLISYLRIQCISVGIIICKKIFIYVYNNLINDYKKLIIEFEKDSPVGEKFVELFSRDSFNKNELEKYIDWKNETSKNINEIKNQINKNLVIDCLKNYFCEQYTSEEIEKALNGFDISVNKKNTIFKCSKCGINLVSFEGDICKECRGIEPVRGDYIKDPTQYRFNGYIYNKRKLVLAVVKYYVSCNPNVSYSELKSIFYDKLQGSLGVVANEEKFRSKPDYRNRFFCKPEDILHLNDENLYVSNQWGIGNIFKFLDNAKNLGYEIEEIKN